MDGMKGLIAQRVRKQGLFYSALCNRSSNKYKGIHREKMKTIPSICSQLLGKGTGGGAGEWP